MNKQLVCFQNFSFITSALTNKGLGDVFSFQIPQWGTLTPCGGQHVARELPIERD